MVQRIVFDVPQFSTLAAPTTILSLDCGVRILVVLRSVNRNLLDIILKSSVMTGLIANRPVGRHQTSHATIL